MNYSKWDKFVAEQSDSDTEQAAPVVHTLEDQQAVKIGPAGYSIENSSTSAPQQRTKAVSSIVKYDSKTINNQELMTNGSKGSNYYWRQDRQEVILTIVLPENVKGKDIIISFNTATKHFTVETTTGIKVLSSVLKYGIDLETMAAADPKTAYILRFDPADWEVKTLPIAAHGDSSSTVATRVVELVMRKKSPLPGAVFWWSACFEGEELIDVTKIAGRTTTSGSTIAAGKEGGDYADKLKNDPYMQAQKLFAERMQSRERIPVDLSNSNDNDSSSSNTAEC